MEINATVSATHQHHSEHKKPDGLKWATFVVGALTLVVVGWYAWTASEQLGQMIRQSDLIKKSADAATDAAQAAVAANQLAGKGLALTKEATDLSRQQLVAVQRAFVFTTGVHAESIGTGDAARIRFRVGWENSGNTPTKDFFTYVNFMMRSGLLPASFDFPDVDANLKSTNPNPKIGRESNRQ